MALPAIAGAAAIVARTAIPSITRTAVSRGAATTSTGAVRGSAARGAIADDVGTAGQGSFKDFASRQLQNQIVYSLKPNQQQPLPRSSKSLSIGQQAAQIGRMNQFLTGTVNE